MAQYGRPSTDTTNQGYTTQAGGGANPFQTIDETVASDADYIQSAQAPTSDVYVTKLTAVTDPVSSSGHIVRYRYSKDAASGSAINLTVELRQGYTSEGVPGTLIATCGTHADIAASFVTASYTLAGAEADAITDYSDLFIRFVSNQV